MVWCFGLIIVRVRIEKLKPQMLVECVARCSYSLSAVSFPPLARHSCACGHSSPQPPDLQESTFQYTATCVHLSLGLEMNTEPTDYTPVSCLAQKWV